MRQLLYCFVLLAIVLSTSSFSIDKEEEWGFWGHRRINRMAVFTLPPEMIVFYKKNIEFITEHAVDPDKRRYATRHEAVRHYIDIDHWGEYPFEDLPRVFDEAVMKYASINIINRAGDTLSLEQRDIDGQLYMQLNTGQGQFTVLYEKGYKAFFKSNVMSQYYEDDWSIDCDSLCVLFGQPLGTLDCTSVYAIDHFSGYGISPYYLPVIQNRLTEAFLQKNIPRILRLSAEIGHYIGDAHVPLHTTENYNGQLTDQVGIHAFWESRIPELFADKQFDYFVGKSNYIADPPSFFWDIILESHQLVDSVLAIEKSLSETFPQDKQYCYEERLGRTIRTQCKDYAAAYNERLSGMVESRMSKTILAVGSCWYTAWIDAGQPNLIAFDEYELSPEERKNVEKLNEQVQQGSQKGRVHE